MFLFWLIFLVISLGGLFSYKRSAREQAKRWTKRWKGNQPEIEKNLRYINLIIGATFTLFAILGMLGIIKTK